MNTLEGFAAIIRRTGGMARYDDGVITRLARLTQLLLAANEKFNLTAITDPADIARLHWEDSLAALNTEPALTAAARRAVDIGSGAGIPALPLAIALPACGWTALESAAKKCGFIESAVAELGLGNMTVLCARAEEAGRSPARESFDIATARAVGPVASLCEIGLPMLRMGGMLLLYKTRPADGELRGAGRAVSMLGGRICPSYYYRLEGDAQERAIHRIEKTAPTPDKYPRRSGIPFKRPL
ncbi:MAG: 16S rRNA (guanine(527)-N(7))-methyltransferase RsmG [bacterium]|nr:16S rRNA (guanine(527)-N(7))-methyltransferase RsmG [Candidatus Sumerlaeota bacterium]